VLKTKNMKKKLFYAMLMVACISLLSFKEVCHGNEATCLKSGVSTKTLPVSSDKELNLSPFYNLLKI
jgi:hypothetical protein